MMHLCLMVPGSGCQNSLAGTFYRCKLQRMELRNFINVLDGIERLPDNYTDLHASTKSSTRVAAFSEAFETVKSLKLLLDYKDQINNLNECPKKWNDEIEMRAREFSKTLQKVQADLNSDDRSIWSNTNSAAFEESANMFIKAVDEIFFKVYQYERLQNIERKLINIPSDHRLESISDEISQLNQDIKETKINASKLSLDILAKGEVATLSRILKRQRRGSIFWFFTFIATLSLASYIIFWISTPDAKLFGSQDWIFNKGTIATTQELSLRAISKVFIGGFALGVLVMVGRIYQTYLHNIVVTQQRIVARDSISQLNATLSATSEETRSKLIEVAARAIFDHTSSGFLPSGTNEFSPIVQSVMDAAKKTK